MQCCFTLNCFSKKIEDKNNKLPIQPIISEIWPEYLNIVILYSYSFYLIYRVLIEIIFDMTVKTALFYLQTTKDTCWK
jgi:hypothetical protein